MSAASSAAPFAQNTARGMSRLIHVKDDAGPDAGRILCDELEAGNILYFQIAEGILCGCEEPEFEHFSWPRLHSGFTALEKKYGVSMFLFNSFALMASKSNDWVAADSTFKRIGDNWNEDTWSTEAWFKQNRDTATQAAPMQIRARATRKEAEDNMQTPEGAAYRKDLEQ